MALNGKGTPVEEPEAAKTGEGLLADIEQVTTEVVEKAEANGALGTLATALAD
jgi:hypothetical protein